MVVRVHRSEICNHYAKASSPTIDGPTTNRRNRIVVADVFEVGGAGAGGGDREVVEAGFGGFCAIGRSGEATELS
jgi:hypothetical protein